MEIIIHEDGSRGYRFEPGEFAALREHVEALNLGHSPQIIAAGTPVLVTAYHDPDPDSYFVHVKTFGGDVSHYCSKFNLEPLTEAETREMMALFGCYIPGPDDQRTDNGFTNAATEHAVLILLNDYQAYRQLIYDVLPDWRHCKGALHEWLERNEIDDPEQFNHVNYMEVAHNIRAKRREIREEEI